MGRRRRAKRQSPLLTSTHHLRAVREVDRVPVRQRLAQMLQGAPDPHALARDVARASTLSGPEAQRLLDLACQRYDGLDEESVAQARRLIEERSIAP